MPRITALWHPPFGNSQAELLGRVTSAYRVAAYGVMPVGATAGGFVAHAFGLRAPWLAAGTVLAVAVAIALPTLRSAADELGEVL